MKKLLALLVAALMLFPLAAVNNPITAPGLDREDQNETAFALMDLAMEKGNAMAACCWAFITEGRPSRALPSMAS